MKILKGLDHDAIAILDDAEATIGELGARQRPDGGWEIETATSMGWWRVQLVIEDGACQGDEASCGELPAR